MPFETSEASTQSGHGSRADGFHHALSGSPAVSKGGTDAFDTATQGSYAFCGQAYAVFQVIRGRSEGGRKPFAVQRAEVLTTKCTGSYASKSETATASFLLFFFCSLCEVR